MIGWSVVEWVTISESQLLYVFCFLQRYYLSRASTYDGSWTTTDFLVALASHRERRTLFLLDGSFVAIVILPMIVFYVLFLFEICSARVVGRRCTPAKFIPAVTTSFLATFSLATWASLYRHRLSCPNSYVVWGLSLGSEFFLSGHSHRPCPYPLSIKRGNHMIYIYTSRDSIFFSSIVFCAVR